MKILLAGGGSGGHFYPLIAVVQEINAIVDAKRLVEPKYFYMGDSPYDEKTLFEYNIEYRHISAGKLRKYASVKNFFDIFSTAFGILGAIWQMFRIYPDVVVGKGGYSSFPTMVAARILRIPAIIHESDSIPGRVNLYAGKFAKRIAISYEEAAEHFPKERTALLGVPVRKELRAPIKVGAREYLKLERDVPVILVVGGSQGAQAINDVILDILPTLLTKYQVLHQAGAANIDEINKRLPVVLADSQLKSRYRLFSFLGPSAMAMAAGVSSLVITRAGSTFLFEIAGWGLPSIVIPIPKEVSRDQHRNAFNYARLGAGVLLEEANLTPHVLLSEIERIMSSPEIRQELATHALAFAKPDAARKMAEAILEIALSHEQ
jgi:UDP-N-acetylglucosamine--N-acetylmuramyl-(pentapeptide) pyrophosphoryl-undecaprenol N-acetylglucosamine transferase